MVAISAAIAASLTSIAGVMQTNAGILTARATAVIKSHSESTDRVSRLEGKPERSGPGPTG